MIIMSHRQKVMRLRKFTFTAIIVVVFYAKESTNDMTTLLSSSPIVNTEISHSLCKRSDILRGKWVERINITAGSEATPDLYQWNLPESSSCQFHLEFNSTLFCNLMTNAVILFIGDSITWEMYESLVSLTGGHVLKRVHNRAIHRKIPIMINVCGNDNVTLVYRWSKYLDGTGTSVSIDTMLKEQFPTMIVLNTGAHYQHDDSYRGKMNHALGQMKDWQQLCQNRNLTCPFFWRTTAPGIPQCKTFTKPVNNIPKMEEYVASNPIYNWEKIRYQNEMALQMLESSGVSYELIDGYEIGIQRPELHVSPTDCLHHSHPAIANAFNIVLLHYLHAIRTWEDVSRLGKYEYDFSRIANVQPSGKDLDWDLVNSL